MMSDVTFSITFRFGKDHKRNSVCECSVDSDSDGQQEGIEKWLNTAQKFLQSIHKK